VIVSSSALSPKRKCATRRVRESAPLSATSGAIYNSMIPRVSAMVTGRVRSVACSFSRLCFTEFHQKNSRSPGGLRPAGSISYVTSMINIEKTGRWLGRGVPSALLCLAATAAPATGPSPLPALKSVAVEVDNTSLPAGEQAALIPILRAARQMAASYIQQMWPSRWVTITLQA
jgi:hypothetical protein